MTDKIGNDIDTDNEIGGLTGIPAVDKTIEEYNPDVGPEYGETAHTLDILGVDIQYLDGKDDGSGSIIDEATAIEYNGPVPVYSDIECKYEQLIGHASLYVENKLLKGDLFIKYNSPERLCIEEGVKLYPALCGTIKVREGAHVKLCGVTGVSLTASKNADDRIKSV